MSYSTNNAAFFSELTGRISILKTKLANANSNQEMISSLHNIREEMNQSFSRYISFLTPKRSPPPLPRKPSAQQVAAALVAMDDFAPNPFDQEFDQELDSPRPWRSASNISSRVIEQKTRIEEKFFHTQPPENDTNHEDDEITQMQKAIELSLCPQTIEKCAICCCNLAFGRKQSTKCGHVFHMDCLRTALDFDPQRRCPMCRHQE